MRSNTSPNSSSISRRMRSKLANRSRSELMAAAYRAPRAQTRRTKPRGSAPPDRRADRSPPMGHGYAFATTAAATAPKQAGYRADRRARDHLVEHRVVRLEVVGAPVPRQVDRPCRRPPPPACAPRSSPARRRCGSAPPRPPPPRGRARRLPPGSGGRACRRTRGAGGWPRSATGRRPDEVDQVLGRARVGAVGQVRRAVRPI